MPTAIEQLTQLQEEVNQANISGYSVGEMRRLSFFEVDGLLHVHYYGLTHREYDWEDEEPEDEIDENQLPVFEALSTPEVSSVVASLTFDGPDDGANGVRDWDFTWLLSQDVTFPELKTLIIQPSRMEAHNLTVVGYEEKGQLAGWLSKAPKLWQMITPSAPNEEFFKVEHESLYGMEIRAGFDAQDFILNLSRQPSPFVWNLDWSEVHNWHMDQWEEGATPFEHFEALFSSPGCPSHIILRNPKLNDEQIRKLLEIQRQQSSALGRSFNLRTFYTYYGLDASAERDFWIERETSGKWRNSLGNEGDR